MTLNFPTPSSTSQILTFPSASDTIPGQATNNTFTGNNSITGGTNSIKFASGETALAHYQEGTWNANFKFRWFQYRNYLFFSGRFLYKNWPLG